MVESLREVYDYGESIKRHYPNNPISQIKRKQISLYQVEIHPPPRGSAPCWLRCNWCYGRYHNIDLKARISKERLIQIVEEIFNPPNGMNNVKQLIFSGVASDPLNTKRGLLEQLVAITRRNGIAYGIHTKLLELSKSLVEVMTSEYSKAGGYITISLDAGDNDTYNKVHNLKAGKLYDRVLNNIRRISLRKKSDFPQIIATYLLCKSNCALETIDLAIKSCADNGVEHIRFSIPQLQYSNRGLRGNLISKDKTGQIKEYIKKRAEGADVQTEIFFIDFTHEQAKDSFKGRILPCFSRWFYPTIGIDGYLYPCCQVATSEFKPLRISNLNEKSFWSSFYNYKYPDISIPIAKLGCKCDRKSLVLNNMMQHSNS